MDESHIHKLIEDYRLRGDQAAFRELFALYEKQIWSYILSRNFSREDAEAIFQEVGLSITRALQKQAPDQFVALVFKITKDCIVDFFRRTSRKNRMETPQKDPDEPRQEPAEPGDPLKQWMDFEQCRQLLTECRLTEEQQESYALHYGLELTVKEIAQRLDAPTETIKGRIYLGKKKIKAYLDRQKRSKP